MTTWRALTLKQPWPWAIVHAGKDGREPDVARTAETA